MANSVHYPSLAEFPDIEMADCVTCRRKTKDNAEKFHIKQTFTDYKKMLDAVKVDAVYILMPRIISLIW